MDQHDNPYAAPQVSLVENAEVQTLEGWSPGRLQLLGYLNLVAALGSLVALGLAFMAGFLEDTSLETFGDWLSPALTLLGCYLVLQLKFFAEQRFAAQNLSNSTWAVVLWGLLVMMLDLLWKSALDELGWQMFGYLAALAIYGILLAWWGFRLRQVQNVYSSFRLMAWLELIGGLMLASVILVVLAMLPLIGASIATAWVFFQAAAEQKSQPS
jgi:hypothetical protein